MTLRFLLPLALIALPTPLSAQALTPAETARIDQLVGTALSGTGTPSASIAVVRGGRIVLAKAYGKQSEAGGAADARLPYQIASISKQFTAAAVLLLEDEGKLSLDDTVAKYIPGVTGGDRITIRPPRTTAIEAEGTPVSPSAPATSVSICAVSAGVSDWAMAGAGSSAATARRRVNIAATKQNRVAGATP